MIVLWSRALARCKQKEESGPSSLARLVRCAMHGEGAITSKIPPPVGLNPWPPLHTRPRASPQKCSLGCAFNFSPVSCARGCTCLWEQAGDDEPRVGSAAPLGLERGQVPGRALCLQPEGPWSPKKEWGAKELALCQSQGVPALPCLIP